MTRVTAASLAYTATQVRPLSVSTHSSSTMRLTICIWSSFSLCSVVVICILAWSDTSTLTPNPLYETVLDFLDDIEEKEEVDELLNWWNWYLESVTLFQLTCS